MIKLSKRLQAVADLVTPGGRVCDVGTDHGYIPLYLLQEGRISYAYAMDVNKGPLLRAEEHIIREKMEQYIETRLSDGMSALAVGEADTIVIAGMGGGLMIRILEAGMTKLEAVKELILQPQSDIEQVRIFIQKHGYEIVQEGIVKEDGKYYFPFRCVPVSEGPSSCETAFHRYGRHLIQSNHPLLQEYLDKEEAQLIAIRDSLKGQKDSVAASRRAGEVAEKLAVIMWAREEMTRCAGKK